MHDDGPHINHGMLGIRGVDKVRLHKKGVVVEEQGPCPAIQVIHVLSRGREVRYAADAVTVASVVGRFDSVPPGEVATYALVCV